MIALDPHHAHWQLDPDTERMTRVAAGDLVAFDELVTRHYSSTVRMIAAMMGTAQPAEDLAQDVFLKIFVARDRYLPTAKFTTWLGTISRNVVLNAKRSRARSRVTFTDWLEDRSLTPPDRGTLTAPSFQHDYAAQLDRQELVELVAAAIDRLPPRQRHAVTLVYFRGLSYAAAAAEMKTTWKAVKSLLGRSRSTLSQSLQQARQRQLASTP